MTGIDDKADELLLSPDDEIKLQCPLCGGNNLHHDNVLVYFRPHDDSEQTYLLDVKPPNVTYDLHAYYNPSSRRDAVGIRFMCETCDLNAELQIVQHKGATYMKWRFVGNSEYVKDKENVKSILPLRKV